MKFSILIANYNNGKYFEDCYRSILNQSYKNWEAVILDDASTDDSVQVIKEIIKEDSRFRFYENIENKGVGYTKSKLIDLAEGEICGFLDPDDALQNTAIADSIKEFKKDKKIALTYSRFIKCDENLKPLLVNKSAHQVLNFDPFFFNCPIIINHFVCFRIEFYKKTDKIDISKKIAEDQDLYLKLYEKGKAKFIDKANYRYRFHSDGISQNENKEKSYEYWAEVIFAAMKRRNLTQINGKKIPETYHNPQEIFDFLEYQNKITFRILKKIKILLQKIS